MISPEIKKIRIKLDKLDNKLLLIVKKRTDNSRVGSSTMVNIKILNIILLSLFSFKKF